MINSDERGGSLAFFFFFWMLMSRGDTRTHTRAVCFCFGISWLVVPSPLYLLLSHFLDAQVGIQRERERERERFIYHLKGRKAKKKKESKNTKDCDTKASQPASISGAMDDLLDGGVGPQRHDPHLCIASRSFQSKRYIQKVLSSVSHTLFEGELVETVSRAESDAGESLKQLIRDNLGVFIGSKDAMDAIFNSDEELFTGAALDTLTSAFQDAMASCDELVQPITATFEEIQRSRRSQEMLDKLFSVLGVPGAIYSCCSVRVAERRHTSAMGREGQQQQQQQQLSHGAEDDDEEEEEDSHHHASSEGRSGQAPGLIELELVHSNETSIPVTENSRRVSGVEEMKRGGALENPGGDSADIADDYILQPNEELYLWYGTPLARWRDVDVRRHHTEESSNYEVAVLHLRRAMLYIEETYSLRDGTMLASDGDATATAAEAGRNSDDASVASSGGLPEAGGDAAPPAGGRPATGAGAASADSNKSIFIYRFSLALLRAALFLCKQLAEELLYANPADTVLIEDTLSSMMDSCIAAVKLHHFCSVLQRRVTGDVGQRQALQELRSQLVKHAAAAAATKQCETPVMSPTTSFASAASPMAAAAASPATALPQRMGRCALQHPAQFFISAVRQQYHRLCGKAADALLREAKAWLWRSECSATRQDEDAKQRRLQQHHSSGLLSPDGTAGNSKDSEVSNESLSHGTGYHLSSLSMAFLPLGGEGGLVGNANDSFLPEISFQGPTVEKTPASPRSSSSPGAAPTAGPSTGAEGMAPNDAVTGRYAAKVLEAFNTPETPFPTSTELLIDGRCMDAVLTASCLQLRLHSASMLQQLTTRADVETAVMAQGAVLSTFALRLCGECIGTLEHVIGSYWGGIATAMHNGFFDLQMDAGAPLYDMLAEVFKDAGESAGGTASGREKGLSPVSTMPSRAASLAQIDGLDLGDDPLKGSGGGGEGTTGTTAGAAATAATAATAPSAAGIDELPPLRFVPVLPEAFRATCAALAKSPTRPPMTPQQPGSSEDPVKAPPTCLRDLSIRAVHYMIHRATTTLQQLLIAFINRSVVDGFVNTMGHYKRRDLRELTRTETTELHAAVLYEVILAQWERMMNLIADSVLRLKIVIGESSSSNTITSEQQVAEVGELLKALEQLRTGCLRAYLHGIGVLSKVYLTTLPLLQRSGDTALELRVRARLSRDVLSSGAVHKLLNLLAVVMDRAVPQYRREVEVFDSVDLFAVKAESLGETEEAAGQASGAGRGSNDNIGRRRRLLRRHRSSSVNNGGGSSAAAASATAASDDNDAVDPVSNLLAQFHSSLVVESLQESEDLLLAMISHLLLAFVDMLHLKCQAPHADDGYDSDEREKDVVESMADALCLSTTVCPILVEHLLTPCFFDGISRQALRSAGEPTAAVAALVQQKQTQYNQVYLAVVEEHCELAVDAMMNIYLSITQQRITDRVRRGGFAQPLFDWQRVSPHTTAAVRPYIADCIACLAQAHETLNFIHQPILGAAATQRLVTHFARAFLTAVSSDVNTFEFSIECSDDFHVYGLSLIEAELKTVRWVVEEVMAHVQQCPSVGAIQPELVQARDRLEDMANTISDSGAALCGSIAAGGGTLYGGLLTVEARRQRCDAMVAAAMGTLGYMIKAITTELVEVTLSGGTLAALHGGTVAGSKGSGTTERIVQRIERRKEGYELRRARAAQEKEQQQQQAQTQKTVAPATGTTETRSRTISRTRPTALQLPPLVTVPDGDAAAAAVPLAMTPVHEQNEALALEAAGDVFKLAVHQQGRQVHRTRRRRLPAKEDSASAAEDAAAAVAAPTVSVAPPKEAEKAVVQVSAPAEEMEGEDAPLRITRRTRERGLSNAAAATAASDAPPRRERRANRFHRANAI